MHEIIWSIEAEQEDIPVRGNAVASGDNDVDKEIEDRILRDLEWNIWAWCSVTVRCTYGPFNGEAHVGCCSYDDEEAFKESSGYYLDMQIEALDDLISNMQDAAKAIEKGSDRLDVLRQQLEQQQQAEYVKQREQR